jgi:protein-tyrosine phosphatase
MMETSVLHDGKKATISVLFVCMGNICRSPLAEGIFRTGLHRRQLTGLVRSIPPVPATGTG